MKQGVPHGLYRRFYAKGSYQTGQYYNGEKVGKWNTYRRDGSIYLQKDSLDATPRQRKDPDLDTTGV